MEGSILKLGDVECWMGSDTENSGLGRELNILGTQTVLFYKGCTLVRNHRVSGEIKQKRRNSLVRQSR
jgi:hypothetical protein